MTKNAVVGVTSKVFRNSVGKHCAGHQHVGRGRRDFSRRSPQPAGAVLFIYFRPTFSTTLVVQHWVSNSCTARGQPGRRRVFIISKAIHPSPPYLRVFESSKRSKHRTFVLDGPTQNCPLFSFGSPVGGSGRSSQPSRSPGCRFQPAPLRDLHGRCSCH